jgi:hypothetical protein
MCHIIEVVVLSSVVLKRSDCTTFAINRGLTRYVIHALNIVKGLDMSIIMEHS